MVPTNEPTGQPHPLSDDQKLWLGVLQKMALAYPASRYADLSAADLVSTARVFADELRAIPTARVLEIYRAMMDEWVSGFAPSVGDFRAAWHRTLIAAPSETFQQKEARENAARGFAALARGEIQLPRFAAVYRAARGVVVCGCTFDGGEMEGQSGADMGTARARNRRFLAGAAIPAIVVDTPQGARWRCAQGRCGFDVDAGDEAATRAVTVPPLLEGAAPVLEKPALLVEAGDTVVSRSRAAMLAEDAELDTAHLNAEQWAALAKMGRWLDFHKRGQHVTRANFAALWEEFEGS